MAGQIIAYVRVSSVDQNTDRQRFDGVKVDKTFTDKCSGGTRNRPALIEMLRYVRGHRVDGTLNNVWHEQ
ncbi:recombinase family protein [Acetobacter cerevisiae]|uniref:Resolvase/invertase-type recombinase catalytic domain-containing protein n=1 Tax=Acetobacter cerevisiae TaxID=178900 RepID=A0A149QV61_9PROT|nr:recombinase family protein [Acetobacter cerevisiae]KXV01218.1 hypothetical protein AD928_01670 [Acetobacter cerevisiae]GBQ09828.1 hypothetical protein AA14362_2388 [Acetobacter cerevisiae DSM 14362]